MYLLPILVAFLAFSAKQASCRTSCTINLNAAFTPQEEPLFLNISGREILYPTHGGQIHVNGGDKIRVFCGSKNFKNFKDHSDDTLIIQCVAGNRFRTLSSQTAGDSNSETALHPRNDFFQFYHHTALNSYRGAYFSCKAPLKATVFSGTPGSCALTRKDFNDDHTEFDIGFWVDHNFLFIIEVCFNTASKSVLWSSHVLTPSVQYHRHKVHQMHFAEDREPYGTLTNVEHLYDRKTQVETIAELVNSKVLARKYIKKDGHSLSYFGRGHLAPKGDFVYAAEQLATFHYINVAPQWQYFNGGQWEKIESALRKFIVEKDVKVRVLTGNIGITQLEDKKGQDKNIYLSYNKTNGVKAVRVPKLFFKLVQFVNSSLPYLDVAIVGINQPYEDHVKMTTNDVVCKDVCNRHPWLYNISKQNNEKQSAGYIYCCDKTEFLDYLLSAAEHNKLEYNGINVVGNEDNSGSNENYVKNENDVNSNEDMFTSK